MNVVKRLRPAVAFFSVFLAINVYSATASSNVGNGSIGIAECDEVLKQYDQCLSLAPPAKRDDLRRSLDMTRESWKSLAAEHAEELATICHESLASSKETLNQYGCTAH